MTVTSDPGGAASVSATEQSSRVHDHTWALLETEFDDCGHSFNRFECACGSVSYT